MPIEWKLEATINRISRGYSGHLPRPIGVLTALSSWSNCTKALTIPTRNVAILVVQASIPISQPVLTDSDYPGQTGMLPTQPMCCPEPHNVIIG